MNTNIILILVIILTKTIKANGKIETIYSKAQCKSWLNKHLTFTDDFEYIGSLVAKLSFDSFNALIWFSEQVLYNSYIGVIKCFLQHQHKTWISIAGSLSNIKGSLSTTNVRC